MLVLLEIIVNVLQLVEIMASSCHDAIDLLIEVIDTSLVVLNAFECLGYPLDHALSLEVRVKVQTNEFVKLLSLATLGFENLFEVSKQ